jgi:hypothetical protein
MSHDGESTNEPEGVASPSIATQCLNVIDRYRTEQTSKGDAIYKLVQTIPAGEDETTESPAKTLESYISMLDDWDRERTLSEGGQQCSREQENTEFDNERYKGRNENARDETEEERECEEPVHKRPKIDPELFPWTVTDRIGGGTLRDECISTKNLVANYTLDVKLAKANLLNSGSAPEFPDSEWKSILSGLSVNLDAVFSGQYSTEHDSKISHEIGDFTISTREASTSKTVRTAGDWFIAWSQAATATTFAFPHRGRECQEYGKHILGLFAAFAEEHHHLIFNYDKAVRKRVALRRDLLLTDIADFGDLRVQFLDVRGASSSKQAQMQAGGGRRSTRRSGEACLHWNKGTCPATAEHCFYQHACSYCHSAGHVNGDCPNKPKTGTERGQRRQAA